MTSFISFVLFLVVVGAVLYFLFRSREKEQGPGKDAYFYIASFILVLVLYWAVTDLFRILLEQILGAGSAYSPSYYGSRNYAQEELLRGISLRLSTIVVGFPLWAFHWYKASSKAVAEMDYHSRKSYALVVMVMTFLGVIGTTTGLVYLGLNAILGVSQNVNQSLPYLLPYSATGIGLWVTHYQIWKKAKEGLILPEKEVK